MGLKEKVDNGEFIMSDLVDAAEEALNKGLVDTGFAVEDTRFEGWTMAHGYDNYDEKENKLVVNEKAKDVYSFWKDAFDRGVISEGVGSLDTEMSAAKAVNNEIFAAFARSEYYRMIADELGMKTTDQKYQDWFNENLIWIPVPSAIKGGQAASYSNPGMLFVGSDVDEEKMPYVQRYIELMLTPELQVNHTINSGKLPVTPEALEQVVETLPFYADHYYLTDFTKVRSPHSDYAVLVEGYTMGVDSILTKGASADEAYETYIKEAQQNVPGDRLIIE